MFLFFFLNVNRKADAAALSGNSENFYTAQDHLLTLTGAQLSHKSTRPSVPPPLSLGGFQFSRAFLINFVCVPLVLSFASHFIPFLCVLQDETAV